MTSWNVSRHPEWDMMYRAGLTAREIADTCHRNLGTVHRHLAVRENYEPGFHSEHAAAFEKRKLKQINDEWKTNFLLLRLFVKLEERLPEIGRNKEEDNLYRWLAAQRKKMMQNELHESKVQILDEIPLWKESPWSIKLEENWKNRLSSLKNYVEIYNSFPHYATYRSEEERQLGVWLHAQHQRRLEGRISSQRLAILNDVLGDWRSCY